MSPVIRLVVVSARRVTGGPARANGPVIGGGLAQLTFPFQQKLTQHFVQGRIDRHVAAGHQFFARYTLDDADQFLPTDFPQFPRGFLSRNQFFTSEYRHVVSDRTLSTFRLGFSRTRIGQRVEANLDSPLPVFKAGALVERYQDDMFNPTFSLGIYRCSNLASFLRNIPASFVGLTPAAELDRYWRFTLFGFYAQDAYQLTPRVTVNGACGTSSPQCRGKSTTGTWR